MRPSMRRDGVRLGLVEDETLLLALSVGDQAPVCLTAMDDAFGLDIIDGDGDGAALEFGSLEVLARIFFANARHDRSFSVRLDGDS